MSREGRSQPIQPFAAHGFLGNTPANGVLPGIVVVVEVDDRRKRLPLLQPFVGNAQYLAVTQATTPNPPAPVSVEADQRSRRQPLIPPTIQHGGLDSGVGVPGTAPPLPVSLDRADQRVRYRPLDPVVLSAALAGFTAAPTVTPPGPFVVPLDERRRFLQAIPPTVLTGLDDSDPPLPSIVEPDQRTRRIRVPDPVVLVGPAPDTTVQANPPAPTVIGFDGARRPLHPPSTVQHGFVDPGPGPVGTTPPPVNVVPLVQRPMFFVALPPQVYHPFVEPVVSPTATGVNQDFASIVSGW